MAKVRWTQKCAGGCGRLLVSGTFATNVHRGWFCADCTRKHRDSGCAVLAARGYRKQ